MASDGATAHLRPISPDDADAVVDFHSRLSERTRYYRYFSPYPTIPPRDLKRFVEVDHHDARGPRGVAGRARSSPSGATCGSRPRTADPSAEVAFVVRDDHQGRGLGSILLEHLAAAAEEIGITAVRGRGAHREPRDAADVPRRPGTT